MQNHASGIHFRERDAGKAIDEKMQDRGFQVSLYAMYSLFSAQSSQLSQFNAVCFMFLCSLLSAVICFVVLSCVVLICDHVM